MQALFDPDTMIPWIAHFFGRNISSSKIITRIDDDDCAVIKWGDSYLVITTDYLNAHPIALELGIGKMRDIGRLLVGANISDLCGSGARPVALLIAIMLPYTAKRSEFIQIMKGVKYEADHYNIPVIGGDSKLGDSRAILAVAIGAVSSLNSLFLRNKAKPDDIIWASGNLGSAAAAAWGYKKSYFNNSWRKWARKAILDPQIPLHISTSISRSGIAHGGTDISDGLGADLLKICSASRVGAIIDIDKIPLDYNVIHAANTANIKPWKFCFASGGDFQFIVTTSIKDRKIAQKAGLFEIGFITKSKDIFIRRANKELLSILKSGHRDGHRMTFYHEIDLAINSQYLGD
ncbi:MAG: thiamine-phosphate kinase [Candidatus Sumerlaeota bacterium]|nr:thiamine-phosphate kinase [Candidatus Sumerlaeota bacterium]